MKNTITRRTALAVSVTLPLLPVSAFGSPNGKLTSDLPANASDAAWPGYCAARARYEENRRARTAFEAALPIGRAPCMAEFEDVEEWRPLSNAWYVERAQYPANPFDLDDDAIDAMLRPAWDAEDTIVGIPAATLTDVERKMVVVLGVGGDSFINPEHAAKILADVRRLNGTPQAGVVS